MWKYQEDNPLDFLDENEQGHYITDPVRLQTCRSQMKLLETKLRNKNTEIKTIKEMFSQSETKSDKFYFENEGLRSKISTLNYEILDLKRREQTMNCSLNEASLKHQKLFNDNISKQSEIERKSKEIQNLCVQIQELELQLVKIGQTEQTIHLNMTETLKQLNRKDGLGFKEDDLNENPKILAKAMSKCSALYNFDIIEIGANVDDVVFVHASDQEKIFEKTLEDIKRTKVNKCQLNIDYSLLNSMSLSQTDRVFESKIPTYLFPENPIRNSSKVLYYTPSLILEQRFEELQSLLYQMKISNDLEQFLENKTSNFFHSEYEHHCSHDHVTKLKFDQKVLFYQNELRTKDDIIKDYEKERKNMERLFEESQTCIFQMTVSHVLEIDVLCDKFETYFAKLEHQKHNFENKANTNIKLLAKEKVEYGMLWEKYCNLQQQVSLSSNESSSLEPQVTKQFFDQKVKFFKEVLLGKDQTIDVLQKQIDSLMVSRPCFSQDPPHKQISPTPISNKSSKSFSKVNSPISISSSKRNKKSSSKSQQNDSLEKICSPMTKQETKSFIYSIPELFEFAPAHFQISLKRNYNSEPKITQRQIQSTKAAKSKVFVPINNSFLPKQKWIQKSTIISKPIQTSNVVQNPSLISKQKWIPKSSFSPKDKRKSKIVQKDSQSFPSKNIKQNSRPWISRFPPSNNSSISKSMPSCSSHLSSVQHQKFVQRFVQINKTTGFSKTSHQSKSNVSKVLFKSPAKKWVHISPKISKIWIANNGGPKLQWVPKHVKVVDRAGL